MSEREIKNALIGGVSLGREDHGILSFWLMLDFYGFHQAFGGYSMDSPVKVDGKFKREGNAFGCQCIIEILDTVGAESWDKLQGKPVRAILEGHTIKGIMNIIDDSRTFIPSELYEQKYKEKEATKS